MILFDFTYYRISKIDISGSFKEPIFSGNLALNNGFLNLNNANKNVTKKNKSKEKYDENWPELDWDKDEKIEILT